MGRCTVSLKLVKSSGVQVARFDMGLDQPLKVSGNFECPECKSVLSLGDLRFSFRLVEGCKIPFYRFTYLCLKCRDSGI